MRTLLFLFIGLIMVVAVIVSNRLAAREAAAEDQKRDEEDAGLDARLHDAATTFRAAAQSIGETHTALRTALTDLAAQCEALAQREADGSGLGRLARAAIIRLLFALYGVVERVTALANHSASETFEPLLDSSVGLIVSATDALHTIADRADEATTRHLEADLDVLRARLDEVG